MEEFKSIWQEWMNLGGSQENKNKPRTEETILRRIQKIEQKRKWQFQSGFYTIIATLLIYMLLLLPFGISLFQGLGLVSIGIGGYILLTTYRKDTLDLNQDDFSLNIREFCERVRERYQQRAKHVVLIPLLYAFFLYAGIHLVIHPFIISIGYYGGIIGAYYGLALAALGFTLHELVKRFRKNELEVMSNIQEFLWEESE